MTEVQAAVGPAGPDGARAPQTFLGRRAMPLTALLLALACGGGDTPTGATSGTPPGSGNGPGTNTGTTVTYSGVFDTGLKGGVITLVATAAATGTLKAAGEAEVALTGTYNTTTATFTMSGGAYTVIAAVDAPQLVGIVSVRGALATGTLAALPVSATVPITHWCGTTNGTSVGGLDLAVQGGTLVGVFQGASSGLPVKGSASATDVSFTWVPGANQTGTAAGKISGTTMAGTWSNSFGSSGTWTVSSAGCQ